MSDWKTALEEAVKEGKVLASSQDNITSYLRGAGDGVAEAAVAELVAQGQWEELNDRFYQTLAFGTGGLRGRTIGKVVTAAEQGAGGPLDRPEHPCQGTATMNYHNVGRAMQGFIRYVKANSSEDKPRFVIGHDTRHFSRDYAEYCAKLCADLGCDAYLFEGPRATPQISYQIRKINAAGGVILTASHNPSHDNGFKAYLDDGGQIVEPAASGIIGEVNALESAAYEALPADQQGKVTVLGAEADEVYMQETQTLLLQPELLDGRSAKVVFTSIHGTGGHITIPLLKKLGFEVLTVPEQEVPDGRFPTVKSPNPENAEALQMAIDLAKKEGADAVIGTDPDCDRMGVAVRNAAGEMELLTGNQIGSLMAWYRIKTMFEKGWLTESNRSRAVLIKTLVTSTLQDTIAHQNGISVVNTLTGFKWIAAKLRKYEEAIPKDKVTDYRSLSEEESRKLRLEYSKFFVFGGEESYGYLGADFVHDKDGNGAVVMFAELVAYAASKGVKVTDLLDEVYQEYGVHLEIGKSIYMEGAEGAAKIAKLAKSYSENPPTEVAGVPVVKVRDFNTDTIFDEEGDEIPAQAMIIVELEDGRVFAVRPSGTEPKIKYYLFGKDAPQPADLAASKVGVRESLEAMWSALEADIETRI
ncbi:phospho-sugar mutase [Roseibacillus ishigakijimensis]|uniref:Phospho-sugar mutase n=1 Tax=Roseibacillus ishigakijimensis TaxID=454146 RepID=A0A934RS12_9BACT|nr:phospho-sugar mutase [Roseibacillus ishigakijimensis]MBK1833964.1 phospho-sugar mutase [Roseibacillus ishigakijimensis]